MIEEKAGTIIPLFHHSIIPLLNIERLWNTMKNALLSVYSGIAET